MYLRFVVEKREDRFNVYDRYVGSVVETFDAREDAEHSAKEKNQQFQERARIEVVR
jgi:hypothetical protein